MNLDESYSKKLASESINVIKGQKSRKGPKKEPVCKILKKFYYHFENAGTGVKSLINFLISLNLSF